jgi:hypothetical protein
MPKEPVLEFKFSQPDIFHCSSCGDGPNEGAFSLATSLKKLLDAFRKHVRDHHSNGEDYSKSAKSQVGEKQIR